MINQESHINLEKFKSLPDNSRVWVYQADRFLSREEALEIQEALNAFVSQWQAHGKGLLAKARILQRIFVVVAVDPNFQEATGCSIDSSVHLIKQFEEQYDIDFFQRLNTVYVKDEQLHLSDKARLKDAINKQIVDAETIVFDNTITQLSQLRTAWEKPLAKSWQGSLL